MHQFKSLNILLCLLAILLCTSCKNRDDGEALQSTVEMTYARLLSMHEGEGFVSVEIRNPWDSTGVLHRYVLVPDGKPMPPDLPQGDIIRTPLRNAAVYSSVHAGLLIEMGCLDDIKGVCDPEYMTDSLIREGLRKQSIADLGESTSPNIEKIMDLNPDGILLSPYQDSGNYGRLGKIGIPLIECADYMEVSALGRAEWIKFFGLLFDKEDAADSIFNAVCDNYNSLKQITKSVKKRPRLLADTKYGATWHVAGGNSTSGRLYADAGADYIFSDVTSSASVPYDPEVVFDRAQDADIWLIRYSQATDKTYSELARDYTAYTQIKAFKTHNIYGCNTMQSRFYEDTPFHPDVTLREYIKLFHPELLPDYELKYFKKLKE